MRSGLLALALLVATGCGSGGFDSAPSGSFSGSGGGFGTGSGGGFGGGSTNEPTFILAADNGLRDLMYSGDGGVATFVTTSDITGDNPDTIDQLFSVNLNTGVVVQISNNTDVESNTIKYGDVDLSDDGRYVVFTSSDDITGDNPDGFVNIFRAATDGSGVIQVTNTSSVLGPFNVQISADGALISFISEADLTGNNPSNYMQIYTVSGTGSSIFQVTNDSVNHFDMAMSDNGSWIAFYSGGDPFGTNSDNFTELFIVGTDGANLSQLTQSDDNFKHTIKISDDGSRVALVSSLDLAQGTTTSGRYQVFVVNSATAEIAQITAIDSDHYENVLDLSGDGQYVGFLSRADIVGFNSNGVDTIYWVHLESGNIGQLLRDGTVASDVSGRTAQEFVFTNDGSYVLFESDDFLSSDATGIDDKLFVAVRQ
ncbi:hypothetical protein [Aliikangiella sp. G2MR2-5]|uniref:TolB family protein n=1 Tax=Aliikangiella sp. G2MR2-5 TaxID=2788943 RepID=UPI0018A9CAC6|nr:hypothetical protein [Aliikangiella sp. G2MR2-5]